MWHVSSNLTNRRVSIGLHINLFFTAARKNKFIRDDTGDPWHTLRAPKRFMQGFANLDGTPQLLIYDMNTYDIRTSFEPILD